MTEPTILLINLLALGISLLFVWGVFRTLWPSRYPKLPEQLLHQLVRSEHNPILSPTNLAWEAGGSFNTAVVQHKGITHLFYRALGVDGVSRIGYAKSADGTHIDERLPHPVLSLAHSPQRRGYRLSHHAGLVASGGSWAGTEDPRAVVLDDRLYLSFSAFAGWDSVRIGVVSLPLAGLEKKRWEWSDPIFLSAPYQVHKNWIIFPKRIGGKIAVLHALNGEQENRVRVDYLDSLDREPERYIESVAPSEQQARPCAWHLRMRGGGPPPIELPQGWLVLYHAHCAKEPHRYKIGALLLDKEDPSRVIGRLSRPLLAPDESYENEGKPGVVYTCGAVTEGDTLRVYYGGGDRVTAVGTTSLSALTRELVS